MASPIKSPNLEAELKLAWHTAVFREDTGEINAYIENNLCEDEEDFDDSFGDLFDSYRHTLVDIWESEDEAFRDLFDRIDQMYDIADTTERLYQCRENNAWEIKPCWNIYTKLCDQIKQLDMEPFDTSKVYKKRIEGYLKMLSGKVAAAKKELSSIDDYFDLSNKDREWLKDASKWLDDLVNYKKSRIFKKLYELYETYEAAVDYCNSQGKTRDNPCLEELSKLKPR